MKHHHFRVSKRNFYRIDYRYVEGLKKGCRPYRYSCCVYTDLAKENKLKTCPHKSYEKSGNYDECLAAIEDEPEDKADKHKHPKGVDARAYLYNHNLRNQ